MVYVLETGDFIKKMGINIAAVPDVLNTSCHSLPAVHELMSTRAYHLELGGAPAFAEEGWDYNGNGLDNDIYTYNYLINFLNTKYPGTTPGATSELFHSHSTSAGGQDDWRADTTDVDYFHFYGVQSVMQTIETTVAKTEVVCNILGFNCNSTHVLEPRYTVGDGTVPARSASRRNSFGDLNAPGAQIFRMTNSNPDLVEHLGLTKNPRYRRWC